MRGAASVLAAAVVIATSTATPAFAGFGAVAYDQDTRKYGASFDQPTRSRAFEAALKECNSSGCVVHAVEPKGCGALALSASDPAWGGADRETLAAAKRDAVQHCQSHTQAGTCTVRVSGCNK